MFKNNIHLCKFFTKPLDVSKIIKLFDYLIILFDKK